MFVYTVTPLTVTRLAEAAEACVTVLTRNLLISCEAACQLCAMRSSRQHKLIHASAIVGFTLRLERLFVPTLVSTALSPVRSGCGATYAH
jgi:hypothetical protein